MYALSQLVIRGRLVMGLVMLSVAMFAGSVLLHLGRLSLALSSLILSGPALAGLSLVVLALAVLALAILAVASLALAILALAILVMLRHLTQLCVWCCAQTHELTSSPPVCGSPFHLSLLESGPVWLSHNHQFPEALCEMLTQLLLMTQMLVICHIRVSSLRCSPVAILPLLLPISFLL